jgi:hypothetical protein
MRAETLALYAAALALVGCASGKPVLFVDEGVSLTSYRSVYVAEIGHFDRAPDAEAARAIHDKIQARLGEHGIALATAKDADGAFVVDGRLSRYAAGSAVERWLVPGEGATECLVEGELRDARTGAKLGVLLSYRTVSGGGLASAGAGAWILDTVANDIADEIAAQMKSAP